MLRSPRNKPDLAGHAYRTGVLARRADAEPRSVAPARGASARRPGMRRLEVARHWRLEAAECALAPRRRVVGASVMGAGLATLGMGRFEESSKLLHTFEGCTHGGHGQPTSACICVGPHREYIVSLTRVRATVVARVAVIRVA